MSRAKQSRHADGEEKRPARRPSGTSLDRKIREQEKELSTLNESRRRKRAAAKDVYNAIGFDAMYRDGICQVEEGLFSQTIAFESAPSEQFPNADLLIFCGEGKATVKLGEESVELAGLHAALVKDAVGISVTVTAQEDACFMIAEVQV